MKNPNDVRVIIAGGREFNDFKRLSQTCDKVISGYYNDDTNITIISGNAKGTDRLGESYARMKGYNLQIFPADWFKYGRKAGIIRNAQMAEYATSDNATGVLIAFWNGKSKGTGNMIDIARSRDMSVYIDICDYEKEKK